MVPGGGGPGGVPVCVAGRGVCVCVMAHLHLTAPSGDMKWQVADHSPSAPPPEQSRAALPSPSFLGDPSHLPPPALDHCYPHTLFPFPSSCSDLPWLWPLGLPLQDKALLSRGTGASATLEASSGQSPWEPRPETWAFPIKTAPSEHPQ